MGINDDSKILRAQNISMPSKVTIDDIDSSVDGRPEEQPITLRKDRRNVTRPDIY